MRGTIAGFVLVAVLGGSAVAAPLKIRNGSAVRVALQGKREAGVGLRPHAGGWRLDMALTQTAVADLFDVTEGSSGNKWSVEVVDGALFLDEETFVAGHAYRLLVRRGTETLGSALIYLYPPSSVASRHRVTFDANETAPAPGDAIAITKKPTL